MSTWAPGNYDGATYEYDAFDNFRRNVLGQSNASSGRDLRYEYNTSTNRLSGLGFPDGTVFAQYQHDPRGNLTRGLFYSGGIVASTVDFEYDRANTLQRITGLDPQIGEQRYRYDAHGHRIDVHTAPGQFGEARYWPVYTRDGTLRGEYRPASGVGSGPNDQYYYLGTQLIARRRGAADVSWFLTNHIGSNVATTDAFGNEIENSRFTPYGERHEKLLERGPAYAGHFEDATGITYMKARYYSGFMGVFLAIDPVDVDPATGGNFNRYAYANNNPFKYVDPDGRAGVLAACAVPGGTQACMAAAGAIAAGAGAVGSTVVEGLREAITDYNESAEPGEQASAEDKALSPEGNVGAATASPSQGVAPPDVGSASEIDPAGNGRSTRAGRAQQKHGDRGGAFDEATGTPEDHNAQGARTLDGIMNSPDRVDQVNPKYGTDVWESPTGRGARFDVDGKFKTFLEPRRSR